MHVDHTDLAVFALIVLAAFSAYVYFSNPFSPPSPTQTPESAATPTQVAQLPELFLPCAVATTPDACAGTAAYDASDFSACQSWASPDACRYFYFMQRAEREKDARTSGQGIPDCLSINNTAIRASCLQQYAFRTGDSTYCQALEYGVFRQSCLDEVSKR